MEQPGRALQSGEVPRHRDYAEPHPIFLPVALETLEHIQAPGDGLGRDVQDGLVPSPHLSTKVNPVRLL